MRNEKRGSGPESDRTESVSVVRVLIGQTGLSRAGGSLGWVTLSLGWVTDTVVRPIRRPRQSAKDHRTLIGDK